MLSSPRPVCVCIHGDLQNHTVFTKIAEQLKEKGYEVLLPDLPGHGLNEKIDQSPLTFLSQYLEEKKIIRPILIGHSSGSLIALEYALKTQNAKSLLLFACSILNPVILQPALENKKEYYKSLSKQMFKKQELIDYSKFTFTTEQELLQKGLSTTDPKGFASLLDFYTELPKRDYSSIKQSCIVVLGENDPFIPSKEVQGLAKSLPNSRCNIISSGHHMLLTHPKVVQDIIAQQLDFLTD